MADYTGWVSLHRKTIESPIYSDSQAVHLWVHLLLSANHKDNTFVKNGSLVTVKRGQLLTGRTLLSAATGLSESKVQRLLETFVSLEMIEQQTNSKSRLISITNYDSYQSTEQQMNSKRTANEQQMNTNNNVNNENNDNKCITTPPAKAVAIKQPKASLSKTDLVTIGFDEQLAEDYLTLRKAKKLPLTKTALINIVREGAECGLNPNQTLNHCITSSWAGFKKDWYLKDNAQGKKVSVISDFLKDPDFDF